MSSAPLSAPRPAAASGAWWARVLVLALSLAVAAASNESAARCASRCSAYSAGPAGCAHYKDAKPYPQLLEACTAGRRAGGALGCALGCNVANVCFGVQNAPDVKAKAAAACGVHPHEGPIKATCVTSFAAGVNEGCTDSARWAAADAEGAAERAAAAAAAEEAAAIARMEASLRAADEERRAAARRAADRARDEERVAARAASEAEAAARAAEAARAGKVRGAGGATE